MKAQRALKGRISLTFAVMGLLGFLFLAVPAVQASPLYHVFTGNNEIVLTYVCDWPESETARYTLLRNNEVIKGPFSCPRYDTPYYHDEGLPKGQTFSYVLQWTNGLYTDTNTPVVTTTTGEVQGTLVKNTNWTGSYTMVSSVLVKPGVTLTIAPSTTIEVSRNGGFTVQGRLEADGVSIIPKQSVCVEGETSCYFSLSDLQGTGSFSLKNSSLSVRSDIWAKSASVFEAVTSSQESTVILDLEGRDRVFSGFNMPNASISLERPGNLTIENNTLGKIEIRRQLIQGTGEYDPPFSGNIFIRNNRMERSDGWGEIWVSGIGSANLSIERNLGTDYWIRLSDFVDTSPGVRQVRMNKGGLYGIYIEGASYLIIARNEIVGDSGYAYGQGVNIKKGCYNSVTNNTIIKQTSGDAYSVGVCLGCGNESGVNSDVAHNEISFNAIKNHYTGIQISAAENNKIHSNIVESNKINIALGGVYVGSDYYPDSGTPSGNTIYNNLFRKHEYGMWNVKINPPCDTESCDNTWSISPTPGTNIVGGPLLGGNYWSERLESDGDHNGIGDQPYSINSANIDTSPLAQDIVVNQTYDYDDKDPNDGICDTDLTLPGSQCTLRAAITEANSRPGKNIITFNIAGSDVPVIKPDAPLPAITGQTAIDATAQPGGRVELDGSHVGAGADGLHFNAGNDSVKGLTVKNFQGNGIISDAYLVSPEGDAIYSLRVDGVEVLNNGKWGLYAAGQLNINKGRGSTSDETNQVTRAAGNGWGGVRSRYAYIDGFMLEVTDNLGPGILAADAIDLTDVKANRNRGPGIQSFVGWIHLNGRTPFLSDEVIGNKGDGICSGKTPEVNEALPYTDGVGIYKSIQIKDNSGWGVHAKGEIILNRRSEGGDTGDFAVSAIAGNGVNQECWTIDDNNWDTAKQATESCGSGGLRARRGGIDVAYIDVSDNNGPGILALKNIDLWGVKANRNKGSGVQSFVGSVHVNARSTLTSDEVIGNKGDGIYAGDKPDDVNDLGFTRGVGVYKSIKITDNSGWGVYAEGGIVLNRSTSFTDTHDTRVSFVTGNGVGEVCWTIGDNDKDIVTPTSYRCGSGGLRARRGGITADRIEVTDNIGPGILANKTITLWGTNSASRNRGPGIQSFTDAVYLSRKGEGGISTVSNNKGDAIRAGVAANAGTVTMDGIIATSLVQIEGNSGFAAIATKGNVSINIFNNAPLADAASFLKDNGLNTECWVMEKNDWDVALQRSCPSGGIYAKHGSIGGAKLEVTGNNGIGVLASGNVTLLGNSVCGNKGGNVGTEGGVLSLPGVTLCDADSDGVSNEVEALAPNNGDGNNDGIPDNQQNNVASLFTQGRVFTTAADAVLPLVWVVATDDFPANRPKGVDFKSGLIEVAIDVGSGGNHTVQEFAPVVVQMRQIFHEASPLGVYWMYGPTPDNPLPHWYKFIFNGTTGARFEGNTVILYVVDGGPGDRDGRKDGRITLVGVSGDPVAGFDDRLRADINGDGMVDIRDALLAMQFMAGMKELDIRDDYIPSGIDVHGDNRIGPPEAIFVLQKVAEVR